MSIYLLSMELNEKKRTPTIPVTVGTTGGSTLKNSHEFYILVESIPKEDRTSHILPIQKIHYFIGIEPLCGEGCKDLFTNQKVIVTKNDQVVWKGQRDWRNKLCRLTLQQSTYFANSAYQQITMS